MNTKIRALKLWLAVLLLTASSHSLLAAPFTGIRGQAFISQPGFAVEVSPGNWLGDGGFTYPTQASFTLLSPRSRLPVGHFTTAADGSFQVSLLPGKYVVVPDARFGLNATPASFVVTVALRHHADILIYYEPTAFQATP